MKSKKRRRAALILLASAALMCAALLDSRFRIVTTEYAIRSSRLPAAFDGFRIVQLSDLHGMEFGEGNSRLVSAVVKARPDIIVLTGDFIETTRELSQIRDMLPELTDIAPTYFVSGNHDWASGLISELKAVLEEHGAHYLSNEYIELTRDGESIIICGVEDPNSYQDITKPDELIHELRAKYPDSFVFLAAHRNYWPEKYSTLGVDLIMCGHAHGGLVRLPFIGGLFGTNMEFFPPYTDGAYSSGQYVMIVSRGLGDSIPLPRFLNNPHIPVAVLKKAPGS